jgi:hypothetical protein
MVFRSVFQLREEEESSKSFKEGRKGAGPVRFPTCNLGRELSHVSLRPKPELNPAQEEHVEMLAPWSSLLLFPHLYP